MNRPGAAKAKAAIAVRDLRAWRYGTLLLACIELGGCGLNGPAHAPPTGTAAVVVDMGLASYDPPTVTIHSGQTVEWRNTSILTHTVTSDPSLMKITGNEGAPTAVPFNSGDVAAGNVY